MADAEDREKAEKLAVAKKRFEQLKKQKAKKAQAEKKETKDKIDIDEGVINKDDVRNEEGIKDDGTEDRPDESVKAVEESIVEEDASVRQDAGVEDEVTTQKDYINESHEKAALEASMSEQSRIRSESFKLGTSQISVPTTGLKLGPLSPGGDSVSDIYKKQAARIEQLEKDYKRLEKECDEKDRILEKVESEVEELREAQADTADLRLKAFKAKEAEEEVLKLRNEITTLERQNSVLQSQVKDKRRQSSTNVTASPDDLSAQLAARINTIESLELEVSNLRHSLSTSESHNTSLTTRIDHLESSLATAETEATSAKQELSVLRNVSSERNEASESETATSADATRIHLLTSDLEAAQRAATDATVRAATLEKKIETLTMLHRESESRSQVQATGRTKELERLRAESADMRAKLTSQSSENARLRGTSASSSSAHVDTGTSQRGNDDVHTLQARIRDLEAEVHDLRSGAWRERRIELQGDEMMEGSDVEGEGGAGGGGAVRSPAKSVYDDVDLNAPTTPGFSRTRSSPYGAFANVLSAFSEVAGTASAAGSALLGNAAQVGSMSSGLSSSAGLRRTSGRGQSMVSEFFGGGGGVAEELDGEDGGGEDDEFDFDEDAFRLAQEEEGRKRIERVREVKRGLKEWEGWRVDIVELRGGEAAGVFDV